MGLRRWSWEKKREFLGPGLDFWAKNGILGEKCGKNFGILGEEACFGVEKKVFGGRKWTRGEIGLSLKNRVKCFLGKGLRW